MFGPLKLWFNIKMLSMTIATQIRKALVSNKNRTTNRPCYHHYIIVVIVTVVTVTVLVTATAYGQPM
jgi:hypothetical protein